MTAESWVDAGYEPGTFRQQYGVLATDPPHLPKQQHLPNHFIYKFTLYAYQKESAGDCQGENGMEFSIPQRWVVCDFFTNFLVS
jgi:hypothetical protein